MSIAALLTLLEALVPSAHAVSPCHDGTVGTDADGDGWCNVDTPISDCDDGDVLVNPNAPEDGVDDLDEDCDGSVLIHRFYVSSMNNLVGMDFTLGGGDGTIIDAG